MDINLEKLMNNTFIISGIGPGPGGVGNYMQYLIKVFKNQKHVKFIYPHRAGTKNRFLNKLIDITINKPIFDIKLRLFNAQEIIILSHQCINFTSFSYLIKKYTKISLYLMDNAFFCIKSYNYIKGDNQECLKCIINGTGQAKINNCKSFPIEISKNSQLSRIALLKKFQKKIKFISLSKTNSLLVEKFFGNDVNSSYSYFLTNELIQNNLPEKNKLFSYDFVFHASDHELKGFNYVIKLAENLPNHSFFIPTSKKINLKNVECRNIRWEQGLDKIVFNSKIILTPSLWSNTPEAAMLKSMKLGKCVALIKNQYGFANELPPDSYIALSQNIRKDVSFLEEVISDKNKLLFYQNNSLIYFNYYSKKAFEQISNLI